MTNETLMTGDAANNTDASQGQQGVINAAETTAAGTPTAQQPNEATPPAAEQGQKDGEKPAAEGEKPEGEGKPTAPEQYEFKFSEGVDVDADTLKEFEAFAREKGLDQESAQAIADFGPKLQEKFVAKQMAAIEQAAKDWGQQAQTDKEFGGDKLQENLSVAKKAVDAFGTPELKALLGKYHPTENPKGTGLGNHPEVIRLLFKAGKAISEDTMVNSNAPRNGVAKDPASVLFPDMK
jgi:hypothetical protein